MVLDTTSTRKIACDANHKGVSNGICDGFGSCQCKPPYFGVDCSMSEYFYFFFFPVSSKDQTHN